MTTSLERPIRTNRPAWFAIGLAATSLALISILSLAFTTYVDPIRDPVSDYGLHAGTGDWFTFAVLLVLIAWVALAEAARLSAVPADRTTKVLFGLWGAGLIVVLIFPGNATTTESTVHGEIHRFGGVLLFGALPLACATLARRLRGEPGWTHAARPLRASALAGAITAAAFGVAQFVPALPQGLLQRIALITQLVVIVTAALAIRGAER